MARSDRKNRAIAGGEAAARAQRGVVVDSQVLETDRTASRAGALIFSTALFVVLFCVVLAIGYAATGQLDFIAILVGLAVGWLGVSAIHIAQQWERIVVLRLGKLNRVSGPGLVFTWPIIEHCALYVDMRTRSIPFGAKETLTADLIPLDIDAVLYWMVWDAEKACMEINNYSLAVQLAAQTALRDAIGRSTVASITIRRNQLDQELTKLLDEKVSEWGITVLSVEIRDIIVPEGLQEAMSLEAQAEQRKKARIILIEAEHDVYEMLDEMEELVGGPEAVSRLRTMHLLNESLREGKGTVVIPSAFAEGFNDPATNAADILKGVIGK